MNAAQSRQAQASAQTAPMNFVDERILAAKLDLAEAKTETKFSQLLGKLDLLGLQMSGLQTKMGELDVQIAAVDTHARGAKSTIIATVIGAAIGIVGLAFAAVAIFQSAMGTTASAYQSGMAAAEVQKK